MTPLEVNKKQLVAQVLYDIMRVARAHPDLGPLCSRLIGTPTEEFYDMPKVRSLCLQLLAAHDQRDQRLNWERGQPNLLTAVQEFVTTYPWEGRPLQPGSTGEPDKMLTVRIKGYQYQWLVEEAADYELSVSDYIRLKLFGGTDDV
jgi:hypothetical protein